MSKPATTVKFNKYYEKLDYPFFNTIRLASPLEEGDTVEIRHPFGSFMATVQFNHRTRVRDIGDPVLMWDTGTFTRAAALEHLREYYPHLDENTDVQLIGFKKDSSCPAKPNSFNNL